MSDCVERQTTIAAPIERVWKALTEVGQFNSWFGVELEQPFVSGQPSHGKIEVQNFSTGNSDELDITIWIERMEAPHLFSYRWHPFAIEPGRDCSNEPKTLVEFQLESVDRGTRLIVRETGFEALPTDRIEPSWRANERGWSIQVDRVKAYVED